VCVGDLGECIPAASGKMSGGRREEAGDVVLDGGLPGASGTYDAILGDSF
jgi:hypothetical protein